MKRLILLLMLLCGFSTLLLCGCSSKELTEEEIEQREMIQKFLGVELPEKCEIVSYEYTLEEDDYRGEVSALVKVNKKEKNNIVEQVERKGSGYVSIESVGESLLEQWPFDTDKIKAIYCEWLGPLRRIEGRPVPMTLFRYVFVVKEDKKWLIYMTYSEKFPSEYY